MNDLKADIELLPEARWEVWYQDTFDRESPRRVDLAGRGLVRGLVELWARHLFETVQPDGGQGFSRFNLWWVQAGRSIQVIGDREGQTLLRGWVFGDKKTADQGYVGSGDEKLLWAVARAHCRLALADRTSEAILAVAADSANRESFEAQLSRLEGEA